MRERQRRAAVTGDEEDRARVYADRLRAADVVLVRTPPFIPYVAPWLGCDGETETLEVT